MWNLIRWVSPRTIKELFVPPTDYRYPFLGPESLDCASSSCARNASTSSTKSATRSTYQACSSRSSAMKCSSMPEDATPDS